jgi:hypothetical protein
MPELNYKEKAKAIWDVMGVGKRAGVQIGMFPQIVMKAAESEGYSGTQLAVALMNVSKEEGEGTSAAAPSVALPLAATAPASNKSEDWMLDHAASLQVFN